MKYVTPFAAVGALLAASSAAVGADIDYTYDALGRLIKADYDSANKVDQYCYDELGNRTERIISTSGATCSAGPTCFLAIWDSGMTVGGPHNFYISRSGTCPSSFNITYSTTDGTALSGVHYYGVSNLNKTIDSSFESISVGTVSGSVTGENMRWFTMTISETLSNVEVTHNGAKGYIEGPDF